MRLNSAPLAGLRGSRRSAGGGAGRPGATNGRSQGSAQSSASRVQPRMVGTAARPRPSPAARGEGANAEPVLPKPPAAPALFSAPRWRCLASPADECWQRAGKKADQILMQPPGVSTEGHQAEVVGAQQRGATGGSCRLLSLFASPFLISENLSLSQPEFQPISSPSTSKRKKQHWRH